MCEVMYCTKCKSFIDHAIPRMTHVGGYNVPAGGYTEHWYACPKCGASNDYFEDAEHCKRCGKAYVKDELNHSFCIECLKSMAYKGWDFINYNNMVDEYAEYMADMEEVWNVSKV